MTVKENFIKLIIDTDDKKVADLYNLVCDYMWNNIEEVEPTEDEAEIISAYKQNQIEF